MGFVRGGLNVARWLLRLLFLGPALLFMGLALLFGRVASAFRPASCGCPACADEREEGFASSQIYFLVPGTRPRRHRKAWARVP
jgi:hypothetical protein